MKGGVKRVHLLDGTISGVLLLELFKRDGMGTMVARYVHSFFFSSLAYTPGFLVFLRFYICPLRAVMFTKEPEMPEWKILKELDI